MSWDPPDDPVEYAAYVEQCACDREQRLPRTNPYWIESLQGLLTVAALECDDPDSFTWEELLAAYATMMAPEGFDEPSVRMAFETSSDFQSVNGRYRYC